MPPLRLISKLRRWGHQFRLALGFQTPTSEESAASIAGARDVGRSSRNPRRLYRLVLVVCWLLPQGFPAQAFTQSAPAEALPEASPEVKQLLDRGKVRFEFYSVRPATQKFDGETRFQFDVDYKIRYQSRTVQRPGRTVAVVGIHFSHLEANLTNTVSLPAARVQPEFWNDSLVQHELQHVQINSDPRIEMLAIELLQSIDQLEIELAPTQSAPTADSVQEAVQREVQVVVSQLTSLLLDYNTLLDRVTQHGTLNQDFDPQFFKRLFTHKSLQDAEFTRLQDVERLLRRKAYRQASGEDGFQ